MASFPYTINFPNTIKFPYTVNFPYTITLDLTCEKLVSGVITQKISSLRNLRCKITVHLTFQKYFFSKSQLAVTCETIYVYICIYPCKITAALVRNAYVFVYMHIYICIYVCTYISIHVCVCVCIYKFTCMCLCVHIEYASKSH